jgi:hypothetical protein
MSQPSHGRVYVREPWASLLVTGAKRIETAHISLPDRFALQWLDVQTEAGEVVGRVVFDGWMRWFDADTFDREFHRHRVPNTSPYHFNNRKRTYGWRVAEFEAFSQPVPAQRMRSQFRLEQY